MGWASGVSNKLLFVPFVGEEALSSRNCNVKGLSPPNSAFIGSGMGDRYIAFSHPVPQ